MNTEDFHLHRTDPLVRWRGIADVLEASPEAWEWALANIERWLAQGGLHPAPLLEWRQWLLEGRSERAKRDALLEALRTPPVDAHQDQLRSCSPFVGGPFVDAMQGHMSRAPQARIIVAQGNALGFGCARNARSPERAA